MDGLLLPLALLILGVPLAGLFLGVASRRRLRELEDRILALEFTAAQLRELARRGFAPVTAPEPGPQAPTPVSEPRPVPPSPEPATPSVFAQPPRPAAPAPPTPITPGRIDAGNGEDLGWRRLEGALGGTWLSRIGALAVTVGIGFFLKYAFDSGWIQPAGRVAMGVAAGMALLLAGERLQRAAYRVPAQALVASGVAALYLSVFAAYAFYQLIAQPVAFGFMVLVTATALALAIHHDARAIAVLANLGGFLTPVLLSTNRDAAVALFTYLAVLDAGMVASAYWRRWPELHVLSFTFTQLLYLAWFQRSYVGSPPPRGIALIGAGVFFLLFSLVTVIEAAARERPTAQRLWQSAGVIALATPAAYFVAARAVMWPEHASWLALLCLVLAAYSVGLAPAAAGAAGVRLTEPETYVRPTLAAVSAAAAGLFLATELHRHPALMSSALRSVTTTLVWLAVATLLLSLVRSDRTATLVVVSSVILAMVGLKAALIDTAVWQSLTPAPPPLLNARFGSGLLVAAAAALYARLAPTPAVSAVTQTQLRVGAVAFAALFLLWHLSAEVMLAPLAGVAPGEMTRAPP